MITCAAPYAPAVGQPEAADLLARRIDRVLEIAGAFAHVVFAIVDWSPGRRTLGPFHEVFAAET